MLIYKLFKKIFFRRIVEDILRSTEATDPLMFWDEFIDKLKR